MKFTLIYSDISSKSCFDVDIANFQQRLVLHIKIVSIKKCS